MENRVIIGAGNGSAPAGHGIRLFVCFDISFVGMCPDLSIQ